MNDPTADQQEIEPIDTSFYIGDKPYRNKNRDVGRNTPCPCGSGKKFKKCCLGKGPARADANKKTKRRRLDADVSRSINHLMQKGYRYQGDSAKACDIWYEAWEAFKPHFTPDMRSPETTDEIFDGDHYFSNWIIDFETELLNAAMDDKTYAELGIKFIKEYLAQFPDEDIMNVRSIMGDLAQIYCFAGRQGEGEQLARSMIDRWPKASAGYITMAHIAEHDGKFDKAAACKMQLEWLEKAKASHVEDSADYDLDQRISDIRAELEAEAT